VALAFSMIPPAINALRVFPALPFGFTVSPVIFARAMIRPTPGGFHHGERGLFGLGFRRLLRASGVLLECPGEKVRKSWNGPP